MGWRWRGGPVPACRDRPARSLRRPVAVGPVAPRRSAALPVGRFDLSTCARLRDELPKHMVEQPRAVIVDPGSDLEIGSDSLTSLSSRRGRVAAPGRTPPLLLVAATAGHRRMLARNGIPGSRPASTG
ncbi:hypothetical protein GCM10018963_54760 [Saccharothrix longispora]